MDAKLTKLLSEKNLVFLGTVMSDGSPQVTPVWANCAGDTILINTAEGRLKHKNILRDNRVAVSVVAKDNPLDAISIRGMVTKITPDYDYTHADKLTIQYMGIPHYPFRRADEKRITLHIKPEKIFIMPKLTPNE